MVWNWVLTTTKTLTLHWARIWGKNTNLQVHISIPLIKISTNSEIFPQLIILENKPPYRCLSYQKAYFFHHYFQFQTIMKHIYQFKCANKPTEFHTFRYLSLQKRSAFVFYFWNHKLRKQNLSFCVYNKFFSFKFWFDLRTDEGVSQRRQNYLLIKMNMLKNQLAKLQSLLFCLLFSTTLFTYTQR